MVRTATRGIVAFVLSVVFVLGGLFLVPSSANAAIGDPVIPLPYTPTQMASALSGYANASDVSKAYTTAYMLAFNAAKNAGQTVEAASATALAATPKPMTAPGVLARAGTPLVAFQAGWAIGQGGLALYGAATGSSYEDVLCSTTPSWYQGVNSFMLLSLAPDCAGRLSTPNLDQPEGVWSVGGSSWPLKSTTSPDQFWYCGPTVQLPAGQAYFYRMNNYAPGVYNSGAGLWTSNNSSQSAICGLTGNNLFYRLVVINPQRLDGLQIRNTTTGAVLQEGTQAARADPNRTIGCTVTHSAGTTSRTALSGGYTESAGIPLRAVSEACKSAWDARPSGSIPSKISVDSTPDGGAKTTLSEQNVSPDALPAETGPAKPGLILYKTVGTVTASCNTWAADCVGWWEETAEGTSTTSPYRCEFAGAVVALVECGPYRTSFDSQTATPTITDPLTGNPTPWAATPSTGNSLSPAVGPGTGVSPAEMCFTDGWASVANPVDWVLVPVKCALVWAFVPRATTTQAEAAKVDDAWSNTYPAQAAASIATVLSALPAASGCSGPHIAWSTDWPAPIDFDAYPLNACDEPIATLAAFARVLSAALLIGYTAWGVSRRVSSVVNAPGIGPSS